MCRCSRWRHQEDSFSNEATCRHSTMGKVVNIMLKKLMFSNQFDCVNVLFSLDWDYYNNSDDNYWNTGHINLKLMWKRQYQSLSLFWCQPVAQVLECILASPCFINQLLSCRFKPWHCLDESCSSNSRLLVHERWWWGPMLCTVMTVCKKILVVWLAS